MNNRLIKDWLKLRVELASLKHQEAKMRQHVVEEHFNGLQPGVNTVRDEFGELKATLTTSYKVLPTLPPELRDTRLFRLKVELDKREYDRLDPASRREVDEHIESKHGTPRVEYAFAEREEEL